MGCGNSAPAAAPPVNKPTTPVAAAPKPVVAPADPAPAPAPAPESMKTEDIKVDIPAVADTSEEIAGASGSEKAAADAAAAELVRQEATEEEERKAAEERAQREKEEQEEAERAAKEEAETALRLEEEEKASKQKKLKTVRSWRERSKEGEISEEDSIKARISKVNLLEKSVSSKRSSIKSPVVNSPTSAKNDFDHLIKVVLLGDCGGGKTSLQVRYIQDNFRTWYVSTVGTDLKFKTVNVHDSKVKLQVWDTAGKERHIGAAPDFYQKALGYVIVYDVTDPTTFANVRNWMKKVEPYYLANILVSVILVGNKCDCEPEERKVTTEEGQSLADEFSVKFFETSAKDNINVSESLEFLAGHVVDKLVANTELYEDFKLSMF